MQNSNQNSNQKNNENNQGLIGARYSRRWAAQPLRELRQSRRIINRAHRVFVRESANVSQTCLPNAVEWLLDNHYILWRLSEQIRTTLKKKRLPSPLRVGSGRVPRICSFADAYLHGCKYTLDADDLVVFFRACGRLDESEVLMLFSAIELALFSKIAYLCNELLYIDKQWHRAQKFAQQWSNKHQQGEREPLPRKISVHFTEYLDKYAQQYFGEGTEAEQALERQLRDADIDMGRFLANAFAIQSELAVTLGNCFVSLRELDSIDKSDTIEQLSGIEQVLALDPAGIYPKMDVETKATYREMTARRAFEQGVDECREARAAILAAQGSGSSSVTGGVTGGVTSSDTNSTPRFVQHVGYYIFDNKKPLKLPSYLTIIAVLTVLFVLPCIAIASLSLSGVMNLGTFAMNIILLLLCLLPASDAAVFVCNTVLMIVAKKRHKTSCLPLPRMDFSEKSNIPDMCKTLVVVPSIMLDVEKAHEMVARLETHYLGNRDDNVWFLLLGDWNDSDKQEREGDDEVYKACLEGIAALNTKYSVSGDSTLVAQNTNDGNVSVPTARFFYLHRKRSFNEGQNAWIGYERKRGGLEQLNSLLGSLGLNGEIQSPYFEVRSCSQFPFNEIKYVVTLDSDTLMPHGTVAQLVGTMAHPLNTPQMNADETAVVHGHALIQPRVICTAEGAGASAFATISSGDAGMDMYAGALSDVYQDLFDEGIFTGKGIYDLTVFSRITAKAIPENTVLSHDLLEGSFVRAALDSGTTFADGCPSAYPSFAKRLHRWVRGDWQLLPWLRKKVPTSDGKVAANPLNSISKWKIFDNLRRSLVAPAVFFVILLAFAGRNLSPLRWTSYVLLAYLLPFLPSILKGLARRIAHPTQRKSRLLAPGSFNDFLRVCMEVVLLPHKAFSMVNAVVITLIRVFVTHKNMLEWVTADEAEKRANGAFGSAVVMMKYPLIVLLLWCLPAFISCCPIYENLTVLGTNAARFRIVFTKEFVVFVALLILWFSAPFVVWLTSRPYSRGYFDTGHDVQKCTLGNSHMKYKTAHETAFLQQCALSTWRYFDSFLNADNSFLPPDNYQEYPAIGVAQRTSPTNIGLAMVSVAAANSFGYVSPAKTADMLLRTAEAMTRLEKWNGHLFNWYNTSDLQPLNPLYVSTVDSGNLVCCLIALREGLTQLKRGLADNVCVDQQGKSRLASKYSVGVRDSLETLLSNLHKQPEDIYKNGNPFLKIIMISELIDEEKHLLDMDSLHCIQHSLVTLLKENGQSLSFNAETGFNIKRSLSLVNDLSAYLKQHETEGEQEQTAQIAHKLDSVIGICDKMIAQTDFLPLYNPKNKLFSIGYDTVLQKRTNSHYDLYATEARLASFAAIACGQVPAEHWAHLGRTPVSVDGRTGPVSWTGTMFEYLMPSLFMQDYRNTLAEQAARLAVHAQQLNGRVHHKPWGISESAFYKLDRSRSYAYKAFGLPGLRLKFEPAGEHVVAPYASVLALRYAPADSVRNLRRLRQLGLFGRFGFYDAADFTYSRLPYKKELAVVRTFMVHHEGMSFLSFANALHQDIIRKWFHAYPAVKAAELLLQEKPLAPTIEEIPVAKNPHEKTEFFAHGSSSMRTFTLSSKGDVRAPSPTTCGLFPSSQYRNPLPRVHFMSNGDLTVMVDENGSGFTRLNNTYLSPYASPSDPGQGLVFYVRDVDSGINICASHHHPAFASANSDLPVDGRFTPGSARFGKTYGRLETQLDICVHPSENCELRTLTLKNNSRRARTYEIYTYGACALSEMADYLAHPAFADFFVRTRFNRDSNFLYAWRKPRDEGSSPDNFATAENGYFWMGTMLVTDARTLGALEFETDQETFIGRNRSVYRPQATLGKQLTGSVTETACSLHPIFAFKHSIVVPPLQSAKITQVTALASSRADIDRILWSMNSPSAVKRAFRLANAYGTMRDDRLPHQLPPANTMQNAISLILFPPKTSGLAGHGSGLGMGSGSPNPTATSSLVVSDVALDAARNTLERKGLWAFGISGDLPIVSILMSEPYNHGVCSAILGMFEYWRSCGFVCDLILLVDEQDSYNRPLERNLEINSRFGRLQDLLDVDGGLHIVRTNSISYEEKCLIFASSAIVLNASKSLNTQLSSLERTANSIPTGHPDLHICGATGEIPTPDDLLFFNQTGGFDRHTHEYKILITPGKHTPSPWSNIVANRNFGFLATESGGGFTWSDNSHGFRITPWSNQTISDPAGELVLISERNSGAAPSRSSNSSINSTADNGANSEANSSFSATPISELRDIQSAFPSNVNFVVTYGQGYVIYEGISNGYYHRYTLFVPLLSHSSLGSSNSTGRPTTAPDFSCEDFSSEDCSPHVRLGILYVKRLKNNANNANKSPNSNQLTVTWKLKPVLGVHPMPQSQSLKGIKLNARTLVINNTADQNYANKVVWMATNMANRTGFNGLPSIVGDEITCTCRLHLDEHGEGTAVLALGSTEIDVGDSSSLQPPAHNSEQTNLDMSTKKSPRFSKFSQFGNALEQLVTPAVQRFLDPANAIAALEQTKKTWLDIISGRFGTPSFIAKHNPLGAHCNVEDQSPVEGPALAVDLLVQTWLPYQILSCRLFARSAFYQSGGAYGFRDQLQDAYGIVDLLPGLTRSQILLHCAHQYVEGDVQHWWHLPEKVGSRTHISDDRLWLPYVVCDYIERTGDYAILAEQCPYLSAPEVPADKHDFCCIPTIIEAPNHTATLATTSTLANTAPLADAAPLANTATPSNDPIANEFSVFTHCCRAIDISLTTGKHGLPLMQGGDWNDGMNTVGAKGTGESVWLGWFLITVLDKFSSLCTQLDTLKDSETSSCLAPLTEQSALRCKQIALNYDQHSLDLRSNIEFHAWDGEWYLRAWSDDGTPLGSVTCDECRIDLISQAWAVLSKAGDPNRAKQAMQSLVKYLVDEENGLIKLLTPPFAQGSAKPGYIKSYIPGTRENGGQYTHAAAWAILACLRLGDAAPNTAAYSAAVPDPASLALARQLFDLINPILLTASPEGSARYAGEPYVLAADVYTASGMAGRAGWTWYTGSAAWMYRVGRELLDLLPSPPEE